MKHRLFLSAIAVALVSCSDVDETIIDSTLRAPAYPLVTIDPYTSAWSAADELNAVPVTHWTGVQTPLDGTIEVDGVEYRWMGSARAVEKLIAPMATYDPWIGRYTFKTPKDGWLMPDFDDSAWEEGEASFGSQGRSESRTIWEEGHIYVRRIIELDELPKNLKLKYNMKYRGTIYLNGMPIAVSPDGSYSNVVVSLNEEQVAAMRPGRNVLAASCECPSGIGRARIDMGLYEEVIVTEGICMNAAEQTSAQVQATQTHYSFVCGPVGLSVSFSAPIYDLKDLDRISRPVNYISYKTTSLDGKKHDVRVKVTASPEWAIDHVGQQTASDSFTRGKLSYETHRSVSQDTLGRKGDNVRIDWGTFYLATPKANGPEKGHFLVGYDDGFSVRYFENDLRPYWNRHGDKTIFDMFEQAEKDYVKDMAECYRFDRELMREACARGGQRYAELCALSYRQCLAAHKLVELPNGEVDLLSKENFSNGSIGTVDVTYPSSPIFMKYNPVLSEALMNHIFDYSESGRWTKPFPAHDVGTYPHATGQTYPHDMPVEEAGNMVVQTAATCFYAHDYAYARKHWESLTKWTDYLVENGLDPDNQLCTDDFAGHFPHNANLSIKAIMAVACYGQMAERMGMSDVAERYISKAREMAAEWMKMADAGDHTRLTFDQPETWSLKYNMVWDKLLGLGIFSNDLAQKEVAWYIAHQNRYGIPLDNRADYTKTDWIVWSATLADSKDDFEALIAPVWDFYNETVDRVAMSDWYFTSTDKHRGFVARSVVGGVFIGLL